jgi:hypothetical protein
MALEKFRAPPLPNAPPQYDPQFVRQLVRVLELYFSQLDSLTPNQAQSYRADHFYGGDFVGTDVTADNLTVTTLEAVQGQINSLSADYVGADYVDTDALHAHTALLTSIMGDSFYGGTFYGDGRYLSTPYNQFLSNSDQTAANVATAYAVTFDTTDFPDGITLSNSSRINVAYQGIYQFNFSIQFQNDTNSTETVDVWFRKNGTDIANSNSQFSIPARKSAGTPASLIAVTPFMVDLQPNDYIQIMWRPSVTTLTIQQLPAVPAVGGVTPAIPATPSVILSVQFISAQFPPRTRVAPLPVIGFGQIGNVSVSIR